MKASKIDGYLIETNDKVFWPTLISSGPRPVLTCAVCLYTKACYRYTINRMHVLGKNVSMWVGDIYESF